MRLHSHVQREVTGSLQTLILIPREESHILYVRGCFHRLEPSLELLLRAAYEEGEAIHLSRRCALRFHHLEWVPAVRCNRDDGGLRVLAPQGFVPRVWIPRNIVVNELDPPPPHPPQLRRPLRVGRCVRIRG